MCVENSKEAGSHISTWSHDQDNSSHTYSLNRLMRSSLTSEVKLFLSLMTAASAHFLWATLHWKSLTAHPMTWRSYSEPSWGGRWTMIAVRYGLIYQNGWKKEVHQFESRETDLWLLQAAWWEMKTLRMPWDAPDPLGPHPPLLAQLQSRLILWWLGQLQEEEF